MTTSVLGTSMTDNDFRQIVAIAASEAGLAIPDGKKSLVQSRVARRMRVLGVDVYRDYLDSLKAGGEETQHLISALTTNVSNFYREAHHFDLVRDSFLTSTPTSKLRFWSAGCSNGQEPYSLAMEILKSIPDAAQRDILILASDIDDTVLEKATSGTYSESEIEGVPAAERAQFFSQRADGQYQISEDVQSLIRFRKLNLNGPSWPMRGMFDAIFCRNVVIYFDDATQADLWPRFHALLKPGGILMLGHSERLHPLDGSGFETVGVTTYQKTEKAGPTSCL